MTELDRDLERKTVRATLVTRLFALVSILLLVAVLTLLVIVTTSIRADQTRNVERSKDTQQLVEDTQQLAEQIESCTTPEGECSKRNARTTGAAVGSINEITIAAVACASQPAILAAPNVAVRIELTKACVRTSLESNTKP